jgi:hypothetical protein
MSYIECPSCGKTALSVATRCPHCSLIFTPGMIEELTPPAEPNRLRRLLVMAGALVVLAVVAVVLQNWMGGGSSADTAPPVTNDLASQPIPPDSANQAEEQPPVVTTTAPGEPAVLEIAPSIRAQPPATSRDSVVDSTPPPIAATPQAAPPVAAAAPRATGRQLQRYAKTWVNVRGARSRNASAVRVLNPGEAVLVDSLSRGWYRVHLGGQPVGYVDRAYLDVEAP